MDIKPTTSLQDRIKALNLNKVSQLSPQKSVNKRPVTPNKTFQSDAPGAVKEVTSPEKNWKKSSPEKRQLKNDTNHVVVGSDSKAEKLYSAVSSNTPLAPTKSSTPQSTMYSTAPSNTPLTPSKNPNPQVNLSSIYSAVPSNTPSTPTKISNPQSPLYSAVPSNTPLAPSKNPNTQANQSSIYSPLPSNTPLAPSRNSNTQASMSSIYSAFPSNTPLTPSKKHNPQANQSSIYSALPSNNPLTISKTPLSTIHSALPSNASKPASKNQLYDEPNKVTSNEPSTNPTTVPNENVLYSDIPGRKPSSPPISKVGASEGLGKNAKAGITRITGVLEGTLEMGSTANSLYADVPSNRPVDSGQPVTESSPANNVVDTGIYATPRDLPINANQNEDRTILPRDIGPRWQKIRKTITDTKLRTMVDMSELCVGTSPDDVTSNLNDDDVILSPNAYKRSHSLADGLSFLHKNDSTSKRPSLPEMSQMATFSEMPSITESPPRAILSPTFGFSRESSFRSNLSTESGNGSDVSEPSSASAYEGGRPRNFSDVSVTHEENNYMTFKCLNDGSDSDLLPNERTLVIVKGDTAFTGKLTLATEADAIVPIPEENPTNSDDQFAQNAEREKKVKGKKLKALKGKLTKAVKNKKQIPASPTHSTSPGTMSPRGALHAPAKGVTSAGGGSTSPQRLLPQSPNLSSQRHMTHSAAMLYPRHGSSSVRHNTHSAAMMSPPRNPRARFSDIPPTLPTRPVSMFPDVKSTAFTSTDAEGVYYDPSQPYEDSESDSGDTLTIEVIHEDSGGNDDLTRRYDDVTPLNAGKRSQSLASLNQDLMDTVGAPRRLSESFGFPRQVSDDFASEGAYMASSMPPIPPPKTKSMRRKAERKLAESEYMTSPSTNVTSSNGQAVKLRNKKQPDNNERKDWPGGRPPSMPSQLPPNPPRPPSMPMDEPPAPETLLNQDENEYVSSEVNERRSAPSSDTSVAKPPALLPRVVIRPTTITGGQKLDTTSSKSSTQQTPWNAGRLPQTATEPQLEDSIYYTVDDPPNGTTQPPDSAAIRQTKTPTLNGRFGQTDASTKPDNRTQFPPQKTMVFHRKISPDKAPPETQKTGIADQISFRRALYTLPSKNSKESETAPPLLPRQPNPKPEKPTPPGKPAFGKTQNIQRFGVKPVTPHKPVSGENKDMVTKPLPKVLPKPVIFVSNTLTSPKPVTDVKTGYTNQEPSRSEPVNMVTPPPRPSKLKKLQQNSEEGGTNDISDQPKITPRSPAIAELGKLISMGGPMSPRLMKTSPPSPKKFPTAEATTVTPEPAVHSNLSPDPVRKPVASQASIRPSMTKAATFDIATSLPTSSHEAGPSARPTIVVVQNTLQSTLSQVNAGSVPASTAGQTARRRAPKRPTVAPPRRPTAPPPPPPDQNKAPEKDKPNGQPAEKAAPPSRPPPPSSEKIKAAEARRKQLSTKGEEDEYNDASIGFKQTDEDNPYADIDDDAFENARRNMQIQSPMPPTRPQNAMKRAVQGISVIANMKKLGTQRRVQPEDIPSNQRGFAASKGIHNGVEEEGVYAGIDDF